MSQTNWNTSSFASIAPLIYLVGAANRLKDGISKSRLHDDLVGQAQT
jgi:hypothetical protein